MDIKYVKESVVSSFYCFIDSFKYTLNSSLSDGGVRIAIESEQRHC
jgi:hypothetical protein